MTKGVKSLCLPLRSGIGLKFAHIDSLLRLKPDIGFVEVHAENYMVDGGLRLAQLEAVRHEYPLSVHGVGLSIGGDAPLDKQHLKRLKRLVDRFEPQQFSEHLAWSIQGGAYLNDLLPLHYTFDRLERVVEHVDHLQSFLGRQVLIENPSSYLSFADSELSETAFLRSLCQRTGCGLLLDVNNIFISSHNLDFDSKAYLRDLPLDATGEIHVAGYTKEVTSSGDILLIDTHSSEVVPEVWDLYRQALELTGPKPTLLERDGELPALEQLIAESQLAEPLLAAAIMAEAFMDEAGPIADGLNHAV